MAKKKELLIASGEVSTKDPELHKKILNAIIVDWNLTTDVQIMLANRMVAVWMKLRYVEKLIDKYGLCWEVVDEGGQVKGVTVNQLAYLNKQLEGEFRSYYRLLKQESNNMKTVNVTSNNFSDWINGEIKDAKKR